MRSIVKCLPGIVFLVSLLIGCSSPTEETADDPNFNAADGYMGGKLYDEFWHEETGFNQNDPNTALYDQYSDFFRCIQCHGWDLLGREGGFAADNAPSNSRPHVADRNLFEKAKTSGITDLFNAIKTGKDPAVRRSVSAELSSYNPETNSVVGDRMPNYGAILSDAQIWNLVKFLKAEAVDVKQLYDFTVSGTYPDATVTFSNIGKDGNAAQGDAIYAEACGICHGNNGMESIMGSVGMHLRTLPHMDAFIYKFGILEMMDQTVLTTQQMKDLFKALSDEGKYPSP